MLFAQAKMPIRKDQIEKLIATGCVDEVENAGMDEDRFFVHLTEEWVYPAPYYDQRTMSFGGFREAMQMVKRAVKA